MKRCSYLWGTRNRDYCELGRSGNLDAMLRDLGAINPMLALDEVKRMLVGFTAQKDYEKQKEAPLAIRYAPMHLYKKGIYILRNVQPFAAICVNGLENNGGDRESIYSWLTLLRMEDLLGSAEYNYLDQIFGTRMLTPKDEENFRKQTRSLDFDALPASVQVRPLEGKLSDAAIYTVCQLYAGLDRRVVIKLKKGDPFQETSLELLQTIYSLLPAHMAAETGFATYEKPTALRDLARDANIRIFVLPGESNVDEFAHLPDQGVLLDLNFDLIAPLDTALAEGVKKWAGLSWKKRYQAMQVLFAEHARANERDYYLTVTQSFFGDPFFTWEMSPKTRFAFGDSMEGMVREAVSLYKEYRRFPLCRQIPWLKARFAARIPDLLQEGHNLPMLCAAMGDYRTQCSGDAAKKCAAYIKWMREMDEQ